MEVQMNKDFAWELFKNTGNLNAYLMMRKFEEGEQSAIKAETVNFLGEENGINKNEGNSNWRS